MRIEDSLHIPKKVRWDSVTEQSVTALFSKYSTCEKGVVSRHFIQANHLF